MYRALVSFSGAISMVEGEVRNITEPYLITDLMRAGYIEKVMSETLEKAEVKHEPKKPTRKRKG